MSENNPYDPNSQPTVNLSTPPYDPTGGAPAKKGGLPVWLVVIIGLVGVLCVCGVVGVGALTMLGPQVQDVFNEISTSVAVDTSPSTSSNTSDDTSSNTSDDTSTSPTAKSGSGIDITNGSDSSLDNGSAEGNVFVSSDSKFQVTAPDDWSDLPELHDDAELHVGNLYAEQYMIVLTEPDGSLDEYSLTDYGELIRDNFVESVQGVGDDGREITINGMPAIQYKLTATVDNLDVTYWMTAVQGSDTYYQILAWTLTDQVSSNSDTILGVIDTFQETN